MGADKPCRLMGYVVHGRNENDGEHRAPAGDQESVSTFHGHPVMTDMVPRALARGKRPINLPSVDTLSLANSILKL